MTLAEVRVTAVQLAYARDGEVEILIPSTFGGEIAEAKVRASSRSDRWTTETFLAALGSDDDRAIAAEIFARTERLERRGPKPALWYGQPPRGGINIHLHGLVYPPVWLSINKDRFLMVGATWNAFPEIAHHDAHAPLAELLGLDHRVGSRSVRVRDLDLDELWATIVECAVGINVAADEADEGVIVSP